VLNIFFFFFFFFWCCRKFLSDCNFRSPGEAQKIDRFVETFAHNFMEQNPGGIIANTDACYVLAYSTIMLNTDAHNPNVKKHMSLPEFIKNNRGKFLLAGERYFN